MKLMPRFTASALAFAAVFAHAGDFRPDLKKDQVGKTPVSFEPMVGTWVVAEDFKEKVIRVDGSPWKASQDAPTKLLASSARRLYGTSNEELVRPRGGPNPPGLKTWGMTCG